MLFSDLQKALQPLMPRILNHPFNVRLANGTLSSAVFNNFLHHDKEYLTHYANALNTIAHRLQKSRCPHANKFYYFSKEMRDTEWELHEKYLKKLPFFFFKAPPPKENPAMLAYIQHLNEATQIKPIPVAIAAVLPCFVIYRELGMSMPCTPEHRFHRWISTYSSPHFLKMTEDMIAIFNEKSYSVQQHQCRNQIIGGFVDSVYHEIDFLDLLCEQKQRSRRVTIY